ncbi:hypothetical protein J32TS6_37140 [Virgibacillus pantothenticus]|uniref:Uncharacterized protein n=1 Tax=Virgibacillus pantothenticus TaxID=1473 RepID=A0A0L0QMJ4_VIRPA|nr:hypothetical protein [Virgibacillus pantothenticus]API93412.1 hypothetical protein BKP57_17300 [Virgibacillus sp. 6R]KNE19729.1 hypothetical protein AFK71_14940 [Virgibacillus pantothenticus]MBU8566223.1 hypothetical protein [Virgibacillus pantothenticus]MBU8640753.1 hypothetical protein [Virgibacillus pantothenticus]MBU8646492.1 hypothetical protein [Virgibacillus pantothenticus]
MSRTSSSLGFKGQKVAVKYLQKIKKSENNYEVKWNVKNRKGKVTSLVKVFHKQGKKQNRVFAIDNGAIPLEARTDPCLEFSCSCKYKRSSFFKSTSI